MIGTAAEPGPPRTYKPSPYSIVHSFFGLACLAEGAVIIVLGWRFGWAPVALGVISLLLGAWLFVSSYVTRRTWCSLTPEKYHLSTGYWRSIPWTDVKEIVIRERPSGSIPGRADRQVIFRGPLDSFSPVNSCVFSESDELESPG